MGGAGDGQGCSEGGVMPAARCARGKLPAAHRPAAETQGSDTTCAADTARSSALLRTLVGGSFKAVGDPSRGASARTRTAVRPRGQFRPAGRNMQSTMPVKQHWQATSGG